MGNLLRNIGIKKYVTAYPEKNRKMGKSKFYTLQTSNRCALPVRLLNTSD